VTTFTNPLARAVQVAITAATSASNGIQQLTNTQNNFGTGNFALQWRGSVPDWTPTANVILLNKHDGTNGYILTLLTTGFLRLTLGSATYDSTVATAIADGYVAVIDVDITAATTTAAGSVVFTLNGVQLGTAVAITAQSERVTNGTFASDITGWSLATSSGGTIAWNAGAMLVDRTSALTAGSQAVSLAAGDTLTVSATATWASGGTATARLSIQAGASTGDTVLASASTAAGASGTLTTSYRAASATTVYIFLGVATATGSYNYDGVTSAVVMSVDNTSSLYVCGTSAVRSAAQWFSRRLFNRAKTVAENLAMFVNGMAAADVGASQSAFYQQDTSAGVDSWSGTTMTVAGNVDAIGGRDNVLSATCTSTGVSESPRIARSNVIPNAGKSARLSFSLYRPAANTKVVGYRVTDVAGLGLFSSTVDNIITTAADTWQTFVLEGVIAAGRGNGIRLYPVNSAGVREQVTGEVLYLDATFTQYTGCTSELLAENAQTDNGQVLDSSGNKQHAKLAESGMSTQGAISARRREVRWTNTWAGTNELQYIGGVNQAILPSNAYIESIVGTVSGATPHDIIVGDGSDTDRYVTITTGLAAGTTSFTVAARTTDGTNLKLTVDPDTDATMSIAWVITYYRLET
jgi:hypothetical protein